jgi:hypothetical protein
MPKLTATPELIENILYRIPEGFIHNSVLAQRLKLKGANLKGSFGREGEYWYDSTRLSADEVRRRRTWCRPTLPDMTANGYFLVRPVREQLETRAQHFQQIGDETALHVLAELDKRDGYAKFSDLNGTDETQASLNEMLNLGMLKQVGELVYDPLRLGSGTMQEITRRQALFPAREEIMAFLQAQPGQTASLAELRTRYSRDLVNDVVNLGGFVRFTVQLDPKHQASAWLRLPESDPQEAENAAKTALKRDAELARAREDEKWLGLLDQTGDTLRPDARDGKSGRTQVIARSYTIQNAAKRLGVRERTLEQAILNKYIEAFTDPEGTRRLPAGAVEQAAAEPEINERITGYEVVSARDISIVAGISYVAARRRLQRAGISRTEPRWQEIRGKWGLPDTLQEFYRIRKERLAEWRAKREAERAEEQRLERERRRQEEEAREELRARLVAAFPTWRHAGRIDQRIYLHVGPPNSGKTHEALNALAEARSGWYLAPLRLLAYEIFDRMNQRGVRCNLLTGEEFIPVEGATITAATVEMFDPIRSGECVIIDEAQLLADPDRGWAWTRAMMEALAPDIHIIGPHTAKNLIQQLAAAAAIPVTVIEHERLAPIQIAEQNWPINDLPPRTILVAFSRQMVLQLKGELERAKRRVSVVYGNLPPEVRRKQADRFANGETEICIATDAVGMGLNLPADYVCFFELEKFDGKQVRYLTPSEVQQIGGRAGRFGLSKAGEIGATNKQDLKLVHQLYYTPPVNLTHARVAPSVEDLDMLPGSLAERLSQWASLQSIPDSLRGAIQTADMAERIELARLLTDEEVEQLGLSAALRIVNAPTRQSTRDYWLMCAHAILKNQPMPMPPDAPQKINTSVDLENIETCVSSADIYLWLAGRREFSQFGPDEHEVRIRRTQWSMRIDVALQHRLDMARRCSKCGAPLPLRYPYGLCPDCHAKRIGSDDFRPRYGYRSRRGRRS